MSVSRPRLTIDRSAARIGRAAAARDAALPRQRRVSVSRRVACPSRGTDACRCDGAERPGVTERVTREKDKDIVYA